MKIIIIINFYSKLIYLLSIALQEPNGRVDSVVLEIFLGILIIRCVALLLSDVGTSLGIGRWFILSHRFLSFFLSRGVIINSLVLWYRIHKDMTSLFALGSESLSVYL